jgi:hypothetical protein
MSMLEVNVINIKNKDEDPINIVVDENITVYDMKIEISINNNIPISNIHIVKSESDLSFIDNSMKIINTNFFVAKNIYYITAKSKCATCGNKSANIIGDCKYCKCKYCLKHRLPESHFCVNIDKCRMNAFTINSNKIMSEKCVASKI